MTFNVLHNLNVQVNETGYLRHATKVKTHSLVWLRYFGSNLIKMVIIVVSGVVYNQEKVNSPPTLKV